MIAMAPAAAIVLVVYVGCSIWSAKVSMTNSKLMANGSYVGLAQYFKLFSNTRWQESVWHLVIIGPFFIAITLAIGVFLAIMIDQKVRGESFFRTIYLYPFSMSFVVTGLVWQWLLNPSVGIEKLMVDFGFTSFKFNWIVTESMVVYTIILALVWHGSGLVMAISLAGLRGIDEDIWKAARIDGIPAWKTYIFIIIPMLGASMASATILLVLGVVRLYDIVVSMTNGGPGFGSEVPAKFVIDNLTERQDIGIATAAATLMLIAVLAIVAPWSYLQHRRAMSGRTA